MGHSVGEVVAACVAGVMTLDDALRLIAAARPPDAVAARRAARWRRSCAPKTAWRRRWRRTARSVAIAAVNAPEQTVISGAAEAVQERLRRACAGQGVRCTPLTVSHAFHSPLVDPILDAFEREAAQRSLRAATRAPHLQPHRAARRCAAEVTRPGYWRRHVREAVRFGDGLKSLAALSPDCVHRDRTAPDAARLRERRVRRRRAGADPVAAQGPQRLGADAGRARIAVPGGCADRLARRGRGLPSRIVDLPTYPFQRERYWFQAQATCRGDRARARTRGTRILGTRLRSAASEVIFESRVSADTPAFVRQHRVQDHVVMPATAYLETLLCAAARAAGHRSRVRRGRDGAGGDAARRRRRIAQRAGGLRTATRRAVAVTLSSAPDEDDPDVEDADPWVGHVTASLRSR